MSSEDSKTRSTIVALLVCCLFFGAITAYYGLRPQQATATALFSISAEPTRILDDRERFDAREFGILQQTQLAYWKSYFVAQSALRAPGMQALAILAPHDDQVQWLIDNINVEFADNSEILSVSLSGPAEYAEDLRQLVDALCDAYLKEAVFDEQQRRLVVRDAKFRLIEDLEKKLQNLGREIHALNATTPEEQAARDVKQSRYAGLDELYRKLTLELENDDLQSVAPDRIRRIQKATIEKD